MKQSVICSDQDFAMTKRTCQGTTRAGKPCGANPLKPGTVLEGVTVTGKWCRQHDEDLPDSARIGGATEGAGRKPKPREVDVIRESIERHSGEINDLLREAMRAERAVVVGNGPTAHMEMVPDWPTRITACRELLDRGYGRPTQSSEVTVITEDQLITRIEEMERELADNDPDRGNAGNAAALPRGESAARR